MEQPTRSNPYLSKLKKRYLLNKEGSTKSTYHLELSASSDLKYAPGDSIAILPHYTEKSVESLRSILKTNTDLTTKYNLDTFTKKFLRTLAELPISNRDTLEQLLTERDTCKAFIEAHTVESALRYFTPEKIDVELILSSLSPILPRMYSIASSQIEHPDEIHLTVATFCYKKQWKTCTGLGSNFLCCNAEIDKTTIPLYIHKSEKFKLPTPETDIIMIGPGTGIAPYRAFLQERRAQKASGSQWLFFGERNRKTDYYYEDFLNKYSLPLKLDLAFSRDQEEKIYVQDKMKKEGKELWRWIENGATLYICGDAKQMARDVQETLQEIAQSEGNLTPEESKNLLKSLRKDNRLQLDVY